MPPSRRQAAVVDIGSNSVRLVIYRLEGRAIWTLFNEKALAGLGRDLSSTGRLSPDGVETALRSLRRFRVVLDGWKAQDVSVVATAAVRDALDGGVFVQLSYSWRPPVAPEPGMTVSRQTVWRNFPPAHVWTYRPQ